MRRFLTFAAVSSCQNNVKYSGLESQMNFELSHTKTITCPLLLKMLRIIGTKSAQPEHRKISPGKGQQEQLYEHCIHIHHMIAIIATKGIL